MPDSRSHRSAAADGRDITAVLEEVTAACGRGTPVMLEIAGDPGLGKTLLLEQLALRARRYGLTVVHGTLPTEPTAPGTVSCLDDLHRIGAPAWNGLHRLLRHRPAAPMLLACALRPRQLAAVQALSLAEADRAWHTERITLQPLDADALTELLPPGTPGPRGELLHRLSGGVPAWLDLLVPLSDADLRELAATGRFSGDLPGGPGLWPRRELAALSPEQLTVARAAAVLGDPFDPATTAEVAGLAGPAVLAALDALAALDIVRADPGAPRFRFRHPLVGAVIHALAPPGRRLASHARAAEALRRTGAGPVDRAPHLARSAAPGDQRAARELRRAGERELPTAPARAVRWLDAARRIAGCREEPGARTSLLSALHEAAERAGQLRLCGELLPDLRELTAAGAPLRWARLVAAHAGLVASGDPEGDREARALLERELRAHPADGPAAATLRLPLAALAAARGELLTVQALLGPDRETGAGRPEEDVRLERSAVQALGRAAAGDLAAPPAISGPAVEILDALGELALAERLDAVTWLGTAWSLAGRWAQAGALYARGVRAAERTGRTGRLPALLTGAGYAHLALGRPGAARECAARAGTAAFVQDRPEPALAARLLAACAAGWTDGPPSAVALLAADPGPAAPGTLAALALLGPAPAAPDRAPGGVAALPPLWRLFSVLAPHGGPAPIPVGDAPLPACVRQLDRARRLTARGQLPEAAAAAGRAKELADRADSRWLRERAADQQRAIGARRPRGEGASAVGPAPLSAREQEIVFLVCQGLANRDIAAALFVSAKTVETHLTRVFRKTGLRSRSAVAAAFADGGAGGRRSALTAG